MTRPREYCPTCGEPPHDFRDGRRRYTPETFKAEFRVGDMISGWATGKIVKITAIGAFRFLYEDDMPRKKEGVGTMAALTGWRKARGGPIPKGSTWRCIHDWDPSDCSLCLTLKEGVA